ncbi:50S ribosomal protein L9 [Buchnera aphidicola]|uniref:50S ribosomal protein L9 n=1 Tax=Buchnera aphidicola TaxID=9 RepID=UPI0031B8AADC
MKIILLTKVKNLGNLGELVYVHSGYARNFLIPKGQAVLATKVNIDIVESKKIELTKKIANKFKKAQDRAYNIQLLEGKIIISSKSGEEGKLFGSVNARDIADKITSLGVTVNKNEIRLPNGVLRSLGTHIVKFNPHHEVSIDITINVIAES